MSEQKLVEQLGRARELFARVDRTVKWRSTQSHREMVVDLMQSGATREQVYEATGISRASLDRWLQEWRRQPQSKRKSKPKARKFKVLSVTPDQPFFVDEQKNKIPKAIRVIFKSGVSLEVEQAILTRDFLENLNQLGGSN